MARLLAGFNPERGRGPDCLGPLSRPSGRRDDQGCKSIRLISTVSCWHCRSRANTHTPCYRMQPIELALSVVLSVRVYNDDFTYSKCEKENPDLFRYAPGSDQTHSGCPRM